MNIQHDAKEATYTEPSKARLRRFRKTVYSYFHKKGRKLPWRRDYNPYHILISEVMLQQTQVDRVVDKFESFISALPDFRALAHARTKTVLALWQGLGYNRRALMLKQSAGMVMKKYGGTLPISPGLLRTLPGIGPATAASIAAFAYNKPTVFLETNIRTVLIHHFFSDRETVADEELLPVAEAALDRKNPRKWYSALMDYGTFLKKEFGNLSRRSSFYKKQSKFEGSRRQLRGEVLRILLRESSLAAGDIRALLARKDQRLDAVLDGLAAEKLVSCRNGRYSIA